MIDRTDIPNDVGRSLSRAVDLDRTGGGSIRGMGRLTTEALWWDAGGRPRTHAPSARKIPPASDRPRAFDAALAERSGNREPTVRRSIALGEPPPASSMATASIANHREGPRLDARVTPERRRPAIARPRGAA